MPALSQTLARLSAQRAAATAASTRTGDAGRYQALQDFGGNPGNLSGWLSMPADLPPKAPLVVVLHGCLQSAVDYDLGTGWSELASRHGFAVLLPEQQRANNPNLCFNWFATADITRTGGEAASIGQMVEAAVARHGLDPDSVFVTGLSAGGAMTAAVLAAFPDMFAGGAVIGGLPYGAAATVPEAFERMRGENIPATPVLVRRARAASGRAGSWPTLSVWHGTEDRTVDPRNADALVGQWLGLHGIEGAPSVEERDGPVTTRVWRDASGRTAVEDHRVAGMGHGAPIGPNGPDGVGRPGPYILDVGVPSTRLIAESWNLISPTARAAAEPAAPLPRALPSAAPVPKAFPPAARAPRRIEAPRAAEAGRDAATGDTGDATGIKGIIEKALRAAGLM